MINLCFKKQKKSLLFISTLLLFLLTNSCGDGESYLTADIQRLPFYLMPSDTKSCKAKAEDVGADTPSTNDIFKKYVQFKNISLTYNRSGYTFELLRIDVKFDSANTTFNCVIAGEELSHLVFDASNPTTTNSAWNGILDPSLTTGFAPNGVIAFKCPVTCGGISTVAKSFVSYGNIQFIGIETETASGDQKPLKLVESIGVENIDTD